LCHNCYVVRPVRALYVPRQLQLPVQSAWWCISQKRQLKECRKLVQRLRNLDRQAPFCFLLGDTFFSEMVSSLLCGGRCSCKQQIKDVCLVGNSAGPRFSQRLRCRNTCNQEVPEECVEEMWQPEAHPGGRGTTIQNTLSCSIVLPEDPAARGLPGAPQEFPGTSPAPTGTPCAQRVRAFAPSGHSGRCRNTSDLR
jgi:hypothetical protein